LLLTLLLLLSQQMTLAHAVGHWRPVVVTLADAEASSTDTREPAFHACHLCICAAQLAMALPVSPAGLNPPASCAAMPCAAPASGIAPAPALAFHSRGPPAH
jgi:hypothetical protein